MSNANWKRIGEAIKNEARLGLGNMLTKARKSLHEVEKVVLRYPISLARMPEEREKLVALYITTTADKLESEIDKLSYFERKFLAEKFPRNEEVEKARLEPNELGADRRLEVANRLNLVRQYQQRRDEFLDTPLTREALSRLSARSEKFFRPLNNELWRKQAEKDNLFVNSNSKSSPVVDSARVQPHEIHSDLVRQFTSRSEDKLSAEIQCSLDEVLKTYQIGQSAETTRQALGKALKNVQNGGPAFETDFTVSGKTESCTAEEADAKFGKFNYASSADNFRAELNELESRHNISQEDRAFIDEALSEIDRQSHLWSQNTGNTLFDFDRINKVLGLVGFMVVPFESPTTRLESARMEAVNARRAIQEDAEKVKQEFVNGAENNPTFGG